MTETRWNETAAVAPPANVPVLGWWTEDHLGAAVRRKGHEWFKTGYYASEKLNPPIYWTDLPAPIQDAKAA